MTERQRDARLRRVYGVTAAQYDAQYVSQGCVCAICKRPPKGKRLSVEHSHATGLIRGLVCSGPRSCNKAIAAVQDDPAKAWAIYQYLYSPPWKPAIHGLPGRCTTSLRRRRALAKVLGRTADR